MGPDKGITTRIGAALFLALLVASLGLALRQGRWRTGESLVRESYDTLHSLADLAAAPPADAPVVIVYLDLRSFLAEKLDPAHPWPRDLHARLVDRLGELGARAIVFDIIFGGPGPSPAADVAFATAIQRSGHVILAGQSSDDSSHMTGPTADWGRLVQVEAPHPPFATAAAGWGIANHILDEDFVVRRYLAGFTSQSQSSLSWATATHLALPLTRAPGTVANANARWLRYYGPPLELPNVSYTQVLQPDGVPPGFFQGKVVFVGARPMAEVFNQRQDEFRNPFRSWGHKELFMPGVEIHATAFLNLLREDSLRRLPAFWESFILGTIALLLPLALLHLRPALATVVALGSATLTTAGATVAFHHGTWFPWLLVAAVQIPVALFGSWLYHFQDWYRVRRHLEAARRAADQRIRQQAALIDKANDAILVEDTAGRLLYANPSAERLYGWSLAELQAADPNPIQRQPALPPEIRSHLQERGEWIGELEQHTRSGRRLLVESRWTLIKDDQGHPTSILIINTDITERKQLEAESHRLQRTEAIGMLASGMAHDLNNALAPVLMGSQLLRRLLPGPDALRILNLIESNTQRGADMVRQVVTFARGRHGELEVIDMRQLLGEMERLIRETFPKSITVSVHTTPTLWPVRGNRTELHQVLLNLCVNARDAMPDGGTLDLALDNLDLTPAEASAIPGGRPGEFVSILVADSGTGIDPVVLPKIFEPFFTTKPVQQGTGLGLSTTARIVRAHDGFISVTSTPGEGTSFELFLPRLVGALRPDPSTVTPQAPSGNGERILIADDDQAIRELIQRGLHDHGYRTLLAASGVEAVAAFNTDPASIALVICDQDMPLLGGHKALDQMRNTRPDLPWILMSGGTAPESGPGPAPANGTHLAKPFELHLLLSHIHTLLHPRS